MDNGNGTVKSITFLFYIIGGFIGIVLVIFNTVYSPLNMALAKECEARTIGDKDILQAFRQELRDQTIIIKEQYALSLNNKQALTELSKDMEYIKKKVN